MNRIALPLAALAMALSSPALGQTVPRQCSPQGDPRVRCADADANAVILVNLERGASTIISVPDDERITAVPVSDNQLMRGSGIAGVRLVADGAEGDPPMTADQSLAVATRSNTVVIKPQADLVPQPLFIIVERNGKPFRYPLQIQTVPRDQAYFSVRLRNVAAEQEAARARAQATRVAREERAARDRLAQVAAAPCASRPDVNFRYTGQGERDLAPVEVCDDGRHTFLRFPGAMRIPAVYMTLPDGREALVNANMGPDGWMTVTDRSRRIILRDGNRVLCLHNHGYDHIGRTTGTGTVAADVVRERREPAP